MPVTFVPGDLFLSSAQVLGHGVSCDAVVGLVWRLE